MILVGMAVAVAVAVAVVVAQGVADGCCCEWCQFGNERMAGSVGPGDHGDDDVVACDPREYQHRGRHHNTRAHSPVHHNRPSRGHVRVYGNRRRR